MSNFYDSETYRVFKKWRLEQRQLELAQSALLQPDWDGVLQTRGRIIELKDIDSDLQKVYKEQLKKERNRL